MTAQTSLSREEIAELIFHTLDTRNHEVRHVKIHPALAFDDPIQCTLETISLTKNPFFTALSWSWGDYQLTGIVQLNGYPWSVPSSLEVALRYLRSTEKTRTFWIDALCINQSGANAAVTERNHQIQLMKLIFSMAPQTVIWLGIPSRELLSFVDRMIVEGSMEPVNDFGIDDIALALVELLSLPWWSRLWVVQEAVLGSKIEMRLGRARFVFHYLIQDIYNFWSDNRDNLLPQNREKLGLEMGRKLRIFHLLEHQHVRASDIRQTIYEVTNPITLQTGPCQVEEDFSTVPPRLDFILENKGSDAPRTLFRLLQICRLRNASDPHDKLFGLLGLLSPEVAAALRPNYAEPAMITYTRLAKCFCRQDHLNFLSQALPSLRNPALGHFPTWLPDWSVSASSSSCEVSPFRCTEALYTTVWLELLAWSDYVYRSDRISFLDDSSEGGVRNTILVTSGIFIDTVSHTTAVLSVMSEEGKLETDMIPWLSAYASALPVAPEGIEKCDIIYLFYRVFGTASSVFCNFALGVNESSSRKSAIKKVFSRSRQRSTDTSEVGSMHAFRKDIVENWLGAALKDTIYHGCILTSRKCTSFVSESEEYVFRMNEVKLLTTTTTNRRLFHTSNYHIGNGPSTMKSGDAIFCLPGAMMPCILRPIPDMPGFYTFVGECYIEFFEDSLRLLPNEYATLNSRTKAYFQSLPVGADGLEVKEGLNLKKHSNIRAVRQIFIK